QVYGQPPAACSDLEHPILRGRYGGEHSWVNWLDRRKCIPPLRFEVIHERPEQRPEDSVAGVRRSGCQQLELGTRDACELVLAYRCRQTVKVGEREMPPPWGSSLDSALIFHSCLRSD
ncbi:MAG TPA: hypothetical protein VNG04_09855, partial [Candidatus Acidoferrum sp.]|nr:hypothetical protein [Candidatus Acidoferrum sp.]